MLNDRARPAPRRNGPPPRARQEGVVLMIALIVLVALTLGGIALVRSSGTTSLIAGNLAFQQAATRSADSGAEDAIRTVMEGMSQMALWNDDLTRGYSASAPLVGGAPGANQTWDQYWRTSINPNPVATPVATKTCVDRVCTLPTDATGNTVSYTIQRLCQTTGDPKLVTTGCASGQRKVPLEGESLAAGAQQFTQLTQYYYRVTARVVGPRNTTSFVQTIVAK